MGGTHTASQQETEDMTSVERAGEVEGVVVAVEVLERAGGIGV